MHSSENTRDTKSIEEVEELYNEENLIAEENMIYEERSLSIEENFNNDQMSSTDNLLSSVNCETDSSSDLNINTRCVMNRRKNDVNFLLANARSLAPKMRSLVDSFNNLDLSFAIITESWLKPGSNLRDYITDLAAGLNLKIIHVSRKAKNGRNAGGGVALVYKPSKCQLNEYRIRRGNAEIVCATGKITGSKRKIVVIGVYLPPKLNASQTRDALENICLAVLKVKEEFHDPYIVIGGDFNGKDFEKSIDDYPDLCVLRTGPTRASAVLDKIACTFADQITSIMLRDPLCTEEGSYSDHLSIYVRAELVCEHKFVQRKLIVRRRNNKGDKVFQQKIVNEQWVSVAEESDPDKMLDQMNDILESIMDNAYPKVQIRVKDTDPPWITLAIRRKIKKKKRIYL